MISCVQPPPSTPPTPNATTSHQVIAFVALLSPSFLPCSSPCRCLQVPIIIAASLFATVNFLFTRRRLPSLRTRTTFDRINLRQLIELGAVLVGPLLRTTPWRSRTFIGYRDFLFTFRMFHHLSFVLVLAPSFSLSCPSLFIGFRAMSPPVQLRAHFRIAKPIHLLISIWTSDFYRTTLRRSSPTRLALHSLHVSFSPSRSPFVRSLQLSPLDWNSYKYHRPASLNSRQLRPTFPPLLCMLFRLLRSIPTPSRCPFNSAKFAHRTFRLSPVY